MIANDDNDYETGDDADPYASDDDGYTSEGGMDAFASPALASYFLSSLVEGLFHSLLYRSVY
jgi:hypothetical protein